MFWPWSPGQPSELFSRTAEQPGALGCHSTCHKSINPKSLVRVQSPQRLHRLQIENFLFLPYSSCELLLLQAKRIPNMGGRNAVLG